MRTTSKFAPRLVPIVLASAAALTLFLSGCSSQDQQSAKDTASSAGASASNAAGGLLSSVNAAIPGVESSAKSVASNAGGIFDNAKKAAFVAAYKAQFSSLADGKQDSEIESLLTATCQQIADGQDKAAAVTNIEQEAANGATKPSADDAGRIYDQAKLACP